MNRFWANKRWLSWLLGGVWLVVVITVVLSRLNAAAPQETIPTATLNIPLATPTTAEFLANVALSNYDGPLDAPVKLVVFSDFDCPFCKAWLTRNLRATLREEFGDQLAVVFRHYPVRGEDSWTVAEAAQCAGEQGKFWAYHDAWFEQHTVGETTEDEMVGIAAAIGLDITSWQTCRDTGQFAAYVQQDFQLAQSTGYVEPPVFFANGRHTLLKIAAQREAVRQALLFSCPEPCASGSD